MKAIKVVWGHFFTKAVISYEVIVKDDALDSKEEK